MNPAQETTLGFLRSFEGSEVNLGAASASALVTEFALSPADLLAEFARVKFILYEDGSWTPLPKSGYPSPSDWRDED